MATQRRAMNALHAHGTLDSVTVILVANSIVGSLLQNALQHLHRMAGAPLVVAHALDDDAHHTCRQFVHAHATSKGIHCSPCTELNSDSPCLLISETFKKGTESFSKMIPFNNSPFFTNGIPDPP